jgi:hypothetical protein
VNRQELRAALLALGSDPIAANLDAVVEAIELLNLDEAAERIERLEAGRARMQLALEKSQDETRAARSITQPVSADAIAGALAGLDAKLRQVLNRLGESEFAATPTPSVWRRWFPGLVPAKRRLAP